MASEPKPDLSTYHSVQLRGHGAGPGLTDEGSAEELAEDNGAFGLDTFTLTASLLFVLLDFVRYVSWQIGGNCGTAESAKARELPAVLANETRQDQSNGGES